MDQLERKLLIILEGNKFSGLLSVGDIQRAIIKNLPLETMVKEVLRDDITVAHKGDEPARIRTKMLEERIECMPVIDDTNNLFDVIFWEDVVGGDIRGKEKINIPVVIMAGGEGTRLKPLTNVLPKPLIPVVDKTIIEDIMDQFVLAGCHEFHISVNYKADMIKQYLKDLNNEEYQLHFFQEEKPLGTAGSLYLLANRMTSPFFVSNCDIIIKQDLAEVYRYHRENRNDITIVAALKHYKIPYGTIESGMDGILTKLSEKPELILKINSGVYLLNPDVLALIPEGKFFHITDLILKLKNKKGRIGIFPISEKSWLDYGLLENLPFLNGTKK
ncbi:mannose-1-phosphate guanylyltransferase [bacterium]|nr:mannose-1-phosphate guanylyltransferase [bacterium]